MASDNPRPADREPAEAERLAAFLTEQANECHQSIIHGAAWIFDPAEVKKLEQQRADFTAAAQLLLAAALKAPQPDTEQLRARDTEQVEQAVDEFRAKIVWREKVHSDPSYPRETRRESIAEADAARQALLQLFSRSTAPQELEQLRADAERWRFVRQYLTVKHYQMAPPKWWLSIHVASTPIVTLSPLLRIPTPDEYADAAIALPAPNTTPAGGVDR